MDSNVTFAWKLIRYSFAAVVFLAGLDKLVGMQLIAAWPKYVSPFVASMLPVDIGIFIIAMGVIEVAVAILLVTRYVLPTLYVVVAWLVLISINLLMIGGMFDIAVRDLLLAICAFAAARLAIAHGYTLKG